MNTRARSTASPSSIRFTSFGTTRTCSKSTAGHRRALGTSFFALCEQIRAAGVWPLAFQGRYPGYIGGVTDNAYYHLAGRERFYEQKDLVPGSFANPEFVTALGLIQRTAQE